MNKDKKITSAVVALLLLMGLTVHANRMGRSASFSVTEDSSMSKLNADTDKVNEASVVDEVIWVVGDEPILKSEVEATRLQAEQKVLVIPAILIVLSQSKSLCKNCFCIRQPSIVSR